MFGGVSSVSLSLRFAALRCECVRVCVIVALCVSELGIVWGNCGVCVMWIMPPFRRFSFGNSFCIALEECVECVCVLVCTCAEMSPLWCL